MLFTLQLGAQVIGGFHILRRSAKGMHRPNFKAARMWTQPNSNVNALQYSICFYVFTYVEWDVRICAWNKQHLVLPCQRINGKHYFFKGDITGMNHIYIWFIPATDTVKYANDQMFVSLNFLAKLLPKDIWNRKKYNGSLFIMHESGEINVED